MRIKNMNHICKHITDYKWYVKKNLMIGIEGNWNNRIGT